MLKKGLVLALFLIMTAGWTGCSARAGASEFSPGCGN